MIGIGFDKKVVSLGCYLRVTSKRKKTTTQQTETNLNIEKVNHFDR